MVLGYGMFFLKEYLIDNDCLSKRGGGAVVDAFKNMSMKYPWMISSDEYDSQTIDKADFELLHYYSHYIDFSKLNKKYAIVLLASMCETFLKSYTEEQIAEVYKYWWYDISTNFKKAVQNCPLHKLTPEQNKIYNKIVMEKLLK